MRILHTSDWHLGRSFHREGLLAAQAEFVDFLIETVHTERVDLVLVAGDVYDRAIPSVDAVRVYEDALCRLADRAVPVVVTSGNHDSARRLGFGTDLVRAAGVYLRTDPERLHEPLVLADEFGPVAVYGVPFLDPEALSIRWPLAARTHEAVMAEAMQRVRGDLAGRSPGTRSVVIAHTWVTGGRPSDSERDISVGGVSHVSADQFAGFDYVALGHLHGRQQILPHVRYSGSPLAYSFSETDHVKGMWLVDLAGSGVREVQFIPAPVPRRLGRLRGRLEDLLGDARHTGHEDRWLQVVLTDEARPRAAMERLRQRFPHTMTLSFEPSGETRAAALPSLDGRSERDVVADFVAAVRNRPADSIERALIEAACEGCSRDPLEDMLAAARSPAQRTSAPSEVA